MKSLLSLLALAATLTLSHGQGYLSLLDGAQDGGGLRTGSGTVDLTLTGNSLSLVGNFSGLSGNVTASHIHGPSGPFPASAGVLYNLGGSVVPLGATSGTVSGNVTLVDGTGGFSLATQLAQLNSGQWYINIHSSTFGGGEIRGIIQVVPEPSLLSVFGLCAGGMLYRLRRKK